MKKYNNLALLGRDMTAKVKRDIDKLNSVSNFTVQYGIPRGEETEDGESIAQIGKWNDYGTETIPARPWLSTVKFRYQKEIHNNILKALDTIKSIDRLKQGEIKIVLEKNISIELINYMRENILEGQWEANAPATIKAKKSSKPLIDKGTMLASVNSFATKRIK